MSHAKALIIMAPLIVVLLTIHLSQDVVYGFEPGNVSDLRAAAISGVWLYATLAFAGRRMGCVFLLLASFLVPIVPLAHMSGNGVAEDIAGFNGAVLFVWTLFAIGVAGPVSFFFAIHGLWRLKTSVLDFLPWIAVPVTAGGAVLGYVFYKLF